MGDDNYTLDRPHCLLSSWNSFISCIKRLESPLSWKPATESRRSSHEEYFHVFVCFELSSMKCTQNSVTSVSFHLVNSALESSCLCRQYTVFWFVLNENLFCTNSFLISDSIRSKVNILFEWIDSRTFIHFLNLHTVPKQVLCYRLRSSQRLTWVNLFLSVHLYIHPCLSVCLIYLSIHPSIHSCLSVCLVCPSIHLSIWAILLKCQPYHKKMKAFT